MESSVNWLAAVGEGEVAAGSRLQSGVDIAPGADELRLRLDSRPLGGSSRFSSHLLVESISAKALTREVFGDGRVLPIQVNI